MDESHPQPSPPPVVVADAAALIDALGGNGAVAALVGLKPSAVCMWRRNGVAHRHRIHLQSVAAARGITLAVTAFDPLPRAIAA